MARVEVEIEETELANEETGRTQPGVLATCTECEHTTESYGTGAKSRRRCLALMRQECPEGLENYYIDPDAEE